MIFRSLIQQNLVIEEMLEPEMFGNDLNNFPLTWDSVKVFSWEECLQNNDCEDTVVFNEYSGIFLTPEHVTFDT